MNFKSLKVVLITSLLAFAGNSLAEEMPTNPKFKAQQIENEINVLLQRALVAVAADLNDDQTMYPIALITRHDGKIGSFGTAESENNKKASVNEQVAHIRKLLVDLAISKQITSSVLAMYATVEEKGKEKRQGINFEVEHVEGVSVVRFVPVTEQLDDQGKKTGKLVIETNIASTAPKPRTVFAGSIVQ